MSWLATAILASLLGTEPDEIDPDPEPESTDEDDVADPVGKKLEQRTTASLLAFDELAVTFAADLGGESEQGGIDVTVGVRTSLHHDFDATVSEIELGIALFEAEPLAFAWERLHTPPLQLTAAQIERKIPSPIVAVQLTDDGEPFGRDGDRLITIVDANEVVLPHGPPQALVAVTAYTLERPSEADVLHILDAGGAADLGALAAWADGQAAEDIVPFDAAARARVLAVVETRIRNLRAPPGFGDFQRINALTAMALACVGPGDLERLLFLQRPMSILLSGTVVSYDDAVAEENALGVAVHGFRRMQSRSDASVQWEAAQLRVRGVALDALLRLAFDPLDFRAAPPSMRRHPTLQVAATQLLSPISTNDVGRVLTLAGEHPEQLADIFRFYIEVGHTPVVEPLVDWLVLEPGHVADIGGLAMNDMGETMLPVLLRRFGDFEASITERMVVWQLLSALPERYAPALAAACGSIGAELPPRVAGATPTVAELLQAIRTADELAQQHRVNELISRIEHVEDDRGSLRARIRDAKELAELAPVRLVEITDRIIALHVSAARELGSEGTAEARVVLAQLRGLPLESRHDDAVRAAVLVEAELTEAQGDRDAALAVLERHDPELADSEVRAGYIAIALRKYHELLVGKSWDAATLLLDRLEALGLVELDVEQRRATISALKRRPLLALAVVIATLVTLLTLLLLHFTGALTRMRARIAGRRRALAHVEKHAGQGAPHPDAGPDADPSLGADPHGEDLADQWARRDDDTRSPLDDFAA
ncbi:MAG: hypothetical protein IAG13_15700 [Deltaproteobacteria bacterium]|nr:hypothetical protein [Nannocystaceae bacterium]